MASTKKIETVKKINDELKNSKSVVLTDHTGITHQQLENLRKNVKKVGGDFMVIKNNLLKKALLGTEFEGKIDDSTFEGPTSLLISLEDELIPLKELVKATKELNLLKIKSGALVNKSLTSEEVIRLARLPTKEVLLSQLLGMLQSPQARLVFGLKGNLVKTVLVLKALAEKKQSN